MKHVKALLVGAALVGPAVALGVFGGDKAALGLFVVATLAGTYAIGRGILLWIENS